MNQDTPMLCRTPLSDDHAQLLQTLLQFGTPRNLQNSELTLPHEVQDELEELIMENEDQERIDNFAQSFADTIDYSVAELLSAQADVVRDLSTWKKLADKPEAIKALYEAADRLEALAAHVEKEVDPFIDWRTK